MKYADLVLKLSPKSEMGLVNKGALYSEIGYKQAQQKELTKEEKESCRDKANKYIQKAKALGWQPENKEGREEYLKSVKAELQKNKPEIK